MFAEVSLFMISLHQDLCWALLQLACWVWSQVTGRSPYLGPGEAQELGLPGPPAEPSWAELPSCMKRELRECQMCGCSTHFPNCRSELLYGAGCLEVTCCTPDRMVVRFGLVTKTMVITQVLWLLQSSGYNVCTRGGENLGEDTSGAGDPK